MSLEENNQLGHLTIMKSLMLISGSWTSGISMPTARHGLVAVAIDNVIYVIGGGPQPGGSSSSLNEIFNNSKG